MKVDTIIEDIKNKCCNDDDYNALFNKIGQIFGFVAKGERDGGIYAGNCNAVDDEATDFFVELIKGNIPGTIITDNDIGREIRRWRTIKKSPANYELFSIISAALLELEKGEMPKFKVLRMSNKEFNNSTSTIWALAGFEKRDGSWEKYELKRADIGTYATNKLKSETRTGKMISPTNAKDLVIKLLESFGGTVMMSDIVKAAKNHLAEDCFMKIVVDDVQGGDENATEDKIQTCYSAKSTPLTEAQLVGIIFEADNRANIVWNEINKMMKTRTGKVNGHKILCLYLLPKYLGEKPPVLADFGPKSTVENINNNVMAILKASLTVEKIDADAGASEDFELYIKSLQHKTIAKINNKCRENGMDNGL
jgi:hypothetical protein